MLRNVIIILVSMAVIGWNIYVFKNRKQFTFAKKNFALGLLVLWLITMFILNIPIILSPLSPAIKGKIVNSETNLPIANCNIKAYWQVMSASVGGGASQTYHQVITKTDEKGEFKISRYPKVLGMFGFFPFMIISHYDGIRIIAYTHGFAYELKELDKFEPTPNLLEAVSRSRPDVIEKTIKLGKNLTPDFYTGYSEGIWGLGGLFHSYNMYGIVTEEDKKYLLADFHYYYKYIQEVFNKSEPDKFKTALITFASAFKNFGDNEKAIEVYQRIKRDFPDSADFADNEIEQLKKTHSGDRGGLK